MQAMKRSAESGRGCKSVPSGLVGVVTRLSPVGHRIGGHGMEGSRAGQTVAQTHQMPRFAAPAPGPTINLPAPVIFSTSRRQRPRQGDLAHANRQDECPQGEDPRPNEGAQPTAAPIPPQLGRPQLNTPPQARCNVFATVYNPEGLRLGNKVLRQRLRGPALAAYYPRRRVTTNDLKGVFGKEIETWDEEEQDRLEHLEEYVLIRGAEVVVGLGVVVLTLFLGSMGGGSARRRRSGRLRVCSCCSAAAFGGIAC